MGCILKGGGGLYARLRVGAVLLAAGEGARIGGRPKCLLELGGVPLIRRALVALSGGGVDELVVVLGHHAPSIEPVVGAFPVTVVHNPHPEQGQASSLRIGLRALGAQLDCVLVALADQPLLHAQDIADLIKAYKQRPQEVSLVQPLVDGVRGNPLVFSAEVREQIESGDADAGCRKWQQRNAAQVLHWPTSNQRYAIDIDTEQDIEQLAQRTGHRLRWPAAFAQGQG